MRGVCGERLVLLYFELQGDNGAFMEMEKKIKFPTTGVFDFPRLILGGEGKYVDKTGLLYRLAKSTADAQLFISRPRRPARRAGVKRYLVASQPHFAIHAVRQSGKTLHIVIW